MTAFRAIFSLIVLALPLHAMAAQGRTATPPKMTPEQRAAAQEKLNSQVNLLPSAPLGAAKTQLRSAVLITRDSVAMAAATASLILRAQSTKSVGVERSQARRLRGQCAAAQRSSVATLTAIASLNTADANGTKLLIDYRAALTEVGRRMAECDKVLGATRDVAAPSSASINAATSQVNAAVARHDRALDNLMRGMEIRM